MEFENPVLPGMHPDPTICRVGRDFYLACSSFEYFPGVPIFHSRDLVGWRQIGHALTRKSQLDLSGVRSSDGIYAPTLRHHDGTFYLVTTLVGRGNFLVTAKHPRGPWSDPCWLDSDGIDPSLAFLDDRVYYTRNGPGADPDHPFVYQAELAWSGGVPSLARKPRVIWSGTGGIWPEAPHLYRRGRWFYLLTAEGGTSYGHSVVVARSGRPYGPFVPSPHGPLLTHRDRPRHAIQATGHADLVELDDGSTWAVLLGIRPTAGRNHHLGRETFLAPVTWGTGRLAAHVAARAEHGRAVVSTLGTARVGRARRFRNALTLAGLGFRPQPLARELVSAGAVGLPPALGPARVSRRRLVPCPRVPSPAAPRAHGAHACGVRAAARRRTGGTLREGERGLPYRSPRRARRGRP